MLVIAYTYIYLINKHQRICILVNVICLHEDHVKGEKTAQQDSFE